jgi:hypothetical protein
MTFYLKPINGKFEVKDSIQFDVDSAYLGMKELKNTPADLTLRKTYDPLHYAIKFIQMERDNGNSNIISSQIDAFTLSNEGILTLRDTIR